MNRTMRTARRFLLGALVMAPWLAGCSGDLDRDIKNMDIKGIGGDPGGDGSGGVTGTGGMVGSGGSGTGGMTPGTGGSSGPPCDVATILFQDSVHGCLDGGGATGCHTSIQKPYLIGSSSDLAASLKGMKATLLCMGGTFVNPADPTSSVLYKVVDGTTCLQTQMPLAPRTAVTQEQKDCLKDWISKIQ